MNKWILHQNEFTRTSLSATVTRVSNFAEKNVCACVFYMSRLPVQVDSVTHFPTQQVKYVNRNALSMFKALNKGCNKNAQFLIQVEGRLKSLINSTLNIFPD